MIYKTFVLVCFKCHFLYTLQDNTGEFTAEQLRANIFDMFVAGTETTSTTLKWAVLFLVNNQEVQERCRTEIKTVVGLDKQPGQQEMTKLPYCQVES